MDDMARYPPPFGRFTSPSNGRDVCAREGGRKATTEETKRVGGQKGVVEGQHQGTARLADGPG